jgi:hypothetical protein
MIKTVKHEIRDKFKRGENNIKTGWESVSAEQVLDLMFRVLEIVSDFDIRISDFRILRSLPVR